MVVGTGLNIQGYKYNTMLIEVFNVLAAVAVLTVIVMVVVVTKATEYQSISQSQSVIISDLYCEFFNSNIGLETTYPHYRLLWFNSIPQTNV